jgi:hypothetical protein
MQKYLIIIIIILLSFIVSCSSMSSLNKIIQSEVLFDGGVSSSGEWEDSLRFKRTSWFHEVQMTNDIFVAELKKDSPFNVWLGTAKRTALQ